MNEQDPLNSHQRVQVSVDDEHAYKAAWAGASVFRKPNSGLTDKGQGATVARSAQPWVAVVPQDLALAFLDDPASIGRQVHVIEVNAPTSKRLAAKGYVTLPKPNTQDVYYAEVPPEQHAQVTAAISAQNIDDIPYSSIERDVLASSVLPRYREAGDVELQLCGRPADGPSSRRIIITGFSRSDGKQGLVGTVVVRDTIRPDFNKNGPKSGRNKSRVNYRDTITQRAVRVWIHAMQGGDRGKYARISALAPLGSVPGQGSQGSQGSKPSSAKFIEVGVMYPMKKRNQGKVTGAEPGSDSAQILSLMAYLDFDLIDRLGSPESVHAGVPSSGKSGARDRAAVFLDAIDPSWAIQSGILALPRNESAIEYLARCKHDIFPYDDPNNDSSNTATENLGPEAAHKKSVSSGAAPAGSPQPEPSQVKPEAVNRAQAKASQGEVSQAKANQGVLRSGGSAFHGLSRTPVTDGDPDPDAVSNDHQNDHQHPSARQGGVQNNAQEGAQPTPGPGVEPHVKRRSSDNPAKLDQSNSSRSEPGEESKGFVGRDKEHTKDGPADLPSPSLI